jgi:hypothetical protein
MARCLLQQQQEIQRKKSGNQTKSNLSKTGGITNIKIGVSNGREPEIGLGRIFNFKLDRFAK